MAESIGLKREAGSWKMGDGNRAGESENQKSF
jgi:hypothetical protein